MHSIRAGSHAESLEEMQVRLEESLGMLRKMYEKEGWFAERLLHFSSGGARCMTMAFVAGECGR